MKIHNQDLSKFSTIRTSSYTDYYCEPNSVSELIEAMEFKNNNNLSIRILGNGSNILFSKKHYSNILFIKLSGSFDFLNINESNIEIGAAYPLKAAGKKLIKSGYEDYIFFNLIPATIGGAITQNAGTGVNEEIKDLCLSIKVLDTKNNEELIFSKEEFEFDYRNSIIKKSRGRYIVLSGIFNNQNITTDIDDLVLRTRDRISEKVNREPIGYSFGSTFKNNSLPAWKCIEKIIESLDRNNNIFYSNKHYNWIINSNKGSGEDALDIIKQTQLLVEEKLNIYLENEVTII
tara:strand:- start:699 stop:1568 length:870 start_codon:yes stop_codon:yes gene_type:complete